MLKAIDWYSRLPINVQFVLWANERERFIDHSVVHAKDGFLIELVQFT